MQPEFRHGLLSFSEAAGLPEVTVIEQIAAKVLAGERVSADEALELYRHAPTALLGRLADASSSTAGRWALHVRS